MVLNTGPLDWESSALTTRSLLHKINRSQVPTFYQLTDNHPIRDAIYAEVLVQSQK